MPQKPHNAFSFSKHNKETYRLLFRTSFFTFYDVSIDHRDSLIEIGNTSLEHFLETRNDIVVAMFKKVIYTTFPQCFVALCKTMYLVKHIFNHDQYDLCHRKPYKTTLVLGGATTYS